MIENVPISLACQIETGMLGQIYDRVFIRRRNVANVQFVIG